MNRLFLFILLIQLPTFASSQVTAYGNFKLTDQEIIYQKIFERDSITPADLQEYFLAQSYISNLVVKDDGVQFDMTDISVDYKKFQFSQVNVPLIIQTGSYSGKVTIGIKDGRYRVSVKSIQFTGNIVYKIITEKDDLTRYATKNSATILAPDWCRPNMLGLLDRAFADKLECKKADEEW